MATLDLTYDDLEGRVAHYLGWGTSVTGEKATRAQEIINSGYREFLNRYDWQFLKPTTTISLWPTTTTGAVTVSGTGNTTLTVSSATFYDSMVGHSLVADTSSNSYTISSVTSSTVVVVDSDASGDDGDTFTITANGDYRLPSDFAHLIGRLFFDYDDSRRKELPQRPLSDILRRRMVDETASTPNMCAISPVASTGSAAQAWNLMTDIPADAVYTMTYRYQMLPSRLASNDYPVGGQKHAETIVAAALAQAETRFNPGEQVQRAEFERLLAGSIKADNKTRPQTAGPYGATQRGREDSGNIHLNPYGYAYYNGVLYGD